MNKIIHIVLSVCVVMCFSCTGKQQQKKTIGVSQCSDDEWRTVMNEEILREASFQRNVEVTIKTAFDSNQKQIRDIESFIADGVDLLIVSPNEGVPLTPVIEKAMNEGIPVILVDRKINSDNYTAFVGADNFQIGKEVGTYVASLLNGQGNIAEIQGLKGSTPATERHEGFMSIIKNYPDIRIVYEADGGWFRKESEIAMTKALETNLPPIDLVYAHNDRMAIGVYDALTNKNIATRPYIIGIDALPGPDWGIQMVMDGIIDATFFYPTGGEKAMQLAMQVLNGEAFEKDNILYTAAVDKTNARILKLQADQISDHQNRIGNLGIVLNENLKQYSNQRFLLFASLIILLIILVLLALLIKAFINKNKSNKILEAQNIAINKQKEELSEQRDQLITLSKNLEEATQAKLVFFTNISHEFRTPLTLIMGPLDSLEKENLSPEGKSMLQLMRKNGNILLRLMDQIIEFRKYENGKLQMQYTYGDFRNFIHEINNSFIELAKRKHIHLSFKPSEDEYIMWFDSEKIEKICYNLLSNAFKFTPENGSIEIRLSKIIQNGEETAELVFSDNGSGIPPEHIQRIFDSFNKVNQSTSGSGIGLAFTKILVEAHQGNISVKSTPQKGTIFTLTFPFKQKDISINEQYPTLTVPTPVDENLIITESDNEMLITEKHDSAKPLILLVEDNPDVRTYIKTLLHNDYEIIEASNGQAGLLLAMRHVPELIISDVMMDVMDGFEFCKQIKDNLSTSHIPVILLTAYAMDDQRATGFESGADAYIPKPFNENILQIRIRKMLENKDRLKEHFQKNLTFGEKKEAINEIDKTFIEKFRNTIEENLSDPDLNVDEIGKKIGLSRIQLYRKVKSLTNYAPNEFIRIIRLKAAEQELINTEKSISEIAYETGFSSPSYFTKCFKEYFNESPTDYVKRIK